MSLFPTVTSFCLGGPHFSPGEVAIIVTSAFDTTAILLCIVFLIAFQIEQLQETLMKCPWIRVLVLFCFVFFFTEF